MKTKTLKVAAAMGLTALLVGSAAAQESASKPVGYETLPINGGFNYLGLRLHEAPVASGTVTAVDADSVTDSNADFSALTGTYVLEIANATGTIQQVASFNDATDIPTADLTAVVAVDDTYTLRPVATLASVFGLANESGLDAGGGGPAGADVVWLPTATGFDKYYYDSFGPSFGGATWAKIDDGGGLPTPIADPGAVNIFYTDGVVLVGAGVDNSLVVTGSVKLTSTDLALQDGFNYLSSISPAGGSLGTMFGAANEAGLDAGGGGPAGADAVWIPTATGFDKYYYDNFGPAFGGATWAQIDDGGGLPTAVADANAVSTDDASGIIIVNAGGQGAVTAGVPSFYSTL